MGSILQLLFGNEGLANNADKDGSNESGNRRVIKLSSISKRGLVLSCAFDVAWVGKTKTRGGPIPRCRRLNQDQGLGWVN